MIGLLLLGMLAVLLMALRKLGYSRASLGAVDQATAVDRPFEIDGLGWDPTPYRSAAALEPIRTDVRQHCAGMSGYGIASCLMNLFARRFPHGAPEREFFSRHYDPVAVWKQHLAGAPGHCVSRSAMMATALLAMGVPARVVQIISRDKEAGHNVAEVWEPGGGWRIFDPSFAGQLQALDGLTSAVGLITPPYPRWTRDPTRAKVVGLDETEALSFYNERGLSVSAIVYPEPWLYTRIGASQTVFPFRGRFVIVGPRSWTIGIGQPLLQAAIALSLLGLATTIVWWLRRRPVARPSVDVVEQGFAPRQELADL